MHTNGRKGGGDNYLEQLEGGGGVGVDVLYKRRDGVNVMYNWKKGGGCSAYF